MRLQKPIVVLKKVALNFPPLEQGPAGRLRPLAPASRLKQQPHTAETLENFVRLIVLMHPKNCKIFPGGP